jgi:hypothetical protein
MLSKKARNLGRRAKRDNIHRLLDPKLPSKVLCLGEMGARDSGGSDVIFTSEEMSNYYSSSGHLRSHLPIMAMMNYFLFPRLLTGRFLMQSVEQNLRLWGWVEFRLGSFG